MYLTSNRSHLLQFTITGEHPLSWPRGILASSNLVNHRRRSSPPTARSGNRLSNWGRESMGAATTPRSLPTKPHSSHNRVRVSFLVLSLRPHLKLKLLSFPYPFPHPFSLRSTP